MCESLVNSLKDDLMDAKNQLKKAKKAKQDTSAIETEITEIRQKQKNNKDNKKIAEKELAELQKHIAEEIKPVIKKYFDYDIPIAKIEDAGRKYNKAKHLWNISSEDISYILGKDNLYYRKTGSKEVVLSGQ